MGYGGDLGMDREKVRNEKDMEKTKSKGQGKSRKPKTEKTIIYISSHRITKEEEKTPKPKLKKQTKNEKKTQSNEP